MVQCKALLAAPSHPSVRTTNAWNGYAFQCFLCQREFDQLHSLNQHLQSPVHFEANRYRCPKCSRQFTVLSALVQHLESEYCQAISFGRLQLWHHVLSSHFVFRFVIKTHTQLTRAHDTTTYSAQRQD